MSRKYAIGGVVVVLVLGLTLGWAAYAGVGPAPGGTAGDTIDEFPTPSDGDDGGSGTSSTSSSSSASSTDAPPFTFTVDELEECGHTCRDVTATLHNEQEETATGVTVYIRIFAGKDNTDTDDIVWEGSEGVSTLEADGHHTTTERVDISVRDGWAIEREDGWITILTAVETDDRTVTFQDSEQVT